MMLYCKSLFNYQRRSSRVVNIGSLKMGGAYPIRIQSMLTSDTMDTEACVQETLGLVAVGCELVRITAPTVKDAANLKNIHRALYAQGCTVPLVADIHFKPEVAMEAAKWVEKVRINPGNFADSKKFLVREYTDIEYEQELERLEAKFSPLVQLCQKRGVAIRIGTNHGSLSDRIMNRYGDTPSGMVESALEFARIARKYDYHNFVFSMKASNPKVMIAAYRLLVARLDQEGGDWNYPIHLGVTEAGDGEDGRIKSAIGIGSLLADGIGDTIRVSLTEDSKYEIPVAQELLAQVPLTVVGSSLLEKKEEAPPTWPLFEYQRRGSKKITATNLPLSENLQVGGDEPVRVVVPLSIYQEVVPNLTQRGEYQPESILENLPLIEIDPRCNKEVMTWSQETTPHLLSVRDGVDLEPIAAFRLLAALIPAHHPILLKDILNIESGAKEIGKLEERRLGKSHLQDADFTKKCVASSKVIGSLLCDGIGDAILIRRELDPEVSVRMAYNILQAAGVRIIKTDYVACPSCGRTLFNLQETTARIKAVTEHLKGVRIAIMGCIVNGPGEMADADFGYVGGAPGKVNLYVGKKAVKFNIPQSEAVEKLVDLIREHGKWVDK